VQLIPIPNDNRLFHWRTPPLPSSGHPLLHSEWRREHPGLCARFAPRNRGIRLISLSSRRRREERAGERRSYSSGWPLSPTLSPFVPHGEREKNGAVELLVTGQGQGEEAPFEAFHRVSLRNGMRQFECPRSRRSYAARDAHNSVSWLQPLCAGWCSGEPPEGRTPTGTL
jgi:hypothetical protein